MSRWLAMVEEPNKNSETVTYTLQEPSKSTLLQVPEVCRLDFSKKETAKQANRETAVLCSIQRGNHRPGAIAMDTRLGTTVTYQLIERLKASHQVIQDRDGSLGFHQGS